VGKSLIYSVPLRLLEKLDKSLNQGNEKQQKAIS